jgi:release factor glutamine methyltransferase
MAEQWTIGRLLTWTTDYLKQHGSESPRLDAEVLLAAARGCRRIDLYTAYEETIDEAVRGKFRDWVRRRAEGMPVAYLVGQREFYSLSFRVTPDVLIPRPETELLVIRLLDLVKECAARQIPTANVTAVDSSPKALEVAQLNAADHGVANRIEFLLGDLLSPVPAERRFDFIASNPPYVSSAEFAKLPPTVKDFEPRDALLAGERGTETIERLLPQAAKRLASGGWLLMEVSPMIETAVTQLIGAQAELESIPTIKDLAGLPRVVQARKR